VSNINVPIFIFMTQKMLPQTIIDIQTRFLNEGKVDWQEAAYTLFEYQSEHNAVYKEYLRLLKYVNKYPEIKDIPHLPITFFKNHQILTGDWKEELVFYSSSTTGKGRSAHLIRDTSWYDEISKKIFETRFGPLKGKLVLALLPGYLERGDSSLVHMVNHFMKVSGHPANGFFLDQFDLLRSIMDMHDEIILFGVPFALLSFIETSAKNSYPGLTIIETGGMKGKGKELPRQELHDKLRSAMNPRAIYSEYGMTELLSQSYTDHTGMFTESPTFHISVKELNDPFHVQKIGKPGTLNVIDLANIHTCCFIETEDMAVDHGDGHFEILGRIDNREIRGCNLLAI